MRMANASPVISHVVKFNSGPRSTPGGTLLGTVAAGTSLSTTASIEDVAALTMMGMKVVVAAPVAEAEEVTTAD